MINVGSQNIPTMFIGDMGVKSAYVGSQKIYERLSSFVYIRLDASAQGGQAENSQH